MKAAILVEQKKPLLIADIEIPKLRYGQVLVKVYYSGICGSQLGEIDGVKGKDKFLPHLLGHEGSGAVVDVGSGVKFVKPGDNVVLHWMKGQGIEAETPVYEWHGKRLNAGWVTTFNEYAVVSENRAIPIPKDFDMQLAALLGCAIPTGFGVINNNAKVRIGESIVVFGVGGIGLSVIQAAVMVSAHPIIAVDIFENKLKLSQKLGATHAISYEEKSLKEKILEIVGQDGADVVVDTTGNIKVIELGYDVTHPQGRTVLVGVPKTGENIHIHSLPLHFGKVLTGSHGGESNPSIDIPRYVRLYQNEKLNLRNLITDTCKLADINAAIDKIRRGKVPGRCIIEMEP